MKADLVLVISPEAPLMKQQVIIEPAATDKRRKTMKTKIQFTDSYSGRAINIVINLTDGEKEYYLREDDKNVIYNKMSSYQRAKIESFFGKMNAYPNRDFINKKLGRRISSLP